MYQRFKLDEKQVHLGFLNQLGNIVTPLPRMKMFLCHICPSCSSSLKISVGYLFWKVIVFHDKVYDDIVHGSFLSYPVCSL